MENDLAPNGRRRVQVPLVGHDGNAFAVVSRCLRAMRVAGWSPQERDAFSQLALAGDYDHLLGTVLAYCDDLSQDEDDEEGYDDDE